MKTLVDLITGGAPDPSPEVREVPAQPTRTDASVAAAERKRRLRLARIRGKGAGGTLTNEGGLSGIPAGASVQRPSLGGGGGNAVKHMIANSVEGVDFICARGGAHASQEGFNLVARSCIFSKLELEMNSPNK